MKTEEQISTRPSRKWAMFLAAVLVLNPYISQAAPVDASSGNSTFRYNLQEPFDLSTVPSSPVQFPGTIEWTVDGRRIVVYPSIPGNSIDVEHGHPGSHVGPNQIHIQGPLLGYASSDVTGGIVYTVEGGAAGSGISRITEKVDIRNKSSAPVPLYAINGMGWLPDPTAPHNEGVEIPDLTGLNVTGTTMAFTQGDVSGGTPRPLITDPPYGPVTVFPATSFTGFNPFLIRDVTLAPGATLTIITELKVGPPAATPSGGATQGTSSGGTQGTSSGGSGGGTQGGSDGSTQHSSDGTHSNPWKKK